MKFTSQGKVSASMCDAEAKLSILGAVQLVQDYVSEFLGALKVDQTTMRAKHGAMWVFTKNQITGNCAIRWGEEYQVTCFISSLSPVRMMIDIIFERNKEEGFYSRIEACVIDLTTQKVRRITSDIIPPSCVDVADKRGNVLRLEVGNIEQYQHIDDVEIRSTSIDFCKHTNNTEYVRFILNCFDVKALIEHPITQFEISYLAQTFEYDKLQILKKVENNTTSVLLCKNSENVVFCRITQKI